jgi:cytochrome c
MRTLLLALVMACGTPPADAPTATPTPTPTAAHPAGPPTGPALGLGRAATAEEIAAWDIDVDASGDDLPPGKGTVEEGKALYAVWCVSCHGVQGEGGIGPKLIAAEPKTGFADDPKLPRTIGNYWPYATTIFDYVRRAMPQMAPGSLSNDQTYALTAYLLHANGAAPADFVADAAAVKAFKMPTKVTFVPDDREGTTTFR